MKKKTYLITIESENEVDILEIKMKPTNSAKSK